MVRVVVGSIGGFAESAAEVRHLAGDRVLALACWRLRAGGAAPPPEPGRFRAAGQGTASRAERNAAAGARRDLSI